jgi:hypothetical protein
MKPHKDYKTRKFQEEHPYLYWCAVIFSYLLMISIAALLVYFIYDIIWN